MIGAFNEPATDNPIASSVRLQSTAPTTRVLGWRRGRTNTESLTQDCCSNGRRDRALASTASSRPDRSYPLLLQRNRSVSNCGSGAHWPVSAHHGVFGLLHIAAHTDPGADLHLAEDDQAGSDH